MLRQGSKVCLQRFHVLNLSPALGTTTISTISSPLIFIEFHFCLTICCKEKCSIFFLLNFSLIYMRQGRNATPFARNDVMIEA